MLMTVLLSDAKDSLGDADVKIGDLVYAGDTLILVTNADDADKYTKAIAEAGANYGLAYNLGKLEHLAVGM